MSNSLKTPLEKVKEARAPLKEKGLFVEQSQSLLMFKQARSFAEVSLNIHKKSLLKPPYDPNASAPFVVNAAFACEMYLKALLSLSQLKKQTHNLSSLFKLLPNKLKDQINKLTKEKSGKFRIEAGLFKDHIKTISNAFVDWRYIYEQKQISANINRILLILTVLDTLSSTEVKTT